MRARQGFRCLAVKKELVKPVFIVGCSRTGSTLQQHLLNAYSDVDIAPEMHFLAPRWLRKDFVTQVKDHVGELKKDDRIDELIRFMRSGKPQGAFWQEFITLNIDASYLRKRIVDSDRGFQSVFDALLGAHARANHKEIWGAKFPVHLSYTPKLIEWYPQCRIVHTIRDPRAIFSSQFHKHCRQCSTRARKIEVGILQFIHISLQLFWAAKIHAKLKPYSNYFPCKYEEVVLKPEETLKRLCSFLEIEFNPEMLAPHVFVGSSYSENRGASTTFHVTSISAWKQKLPDSVAALVKIVNKSSMKAFGYY